MKKLIRTAAALFCAALCFALMAAAAPAEDIASGVSGTCSWRITSEGELIISPTNGTEGTLGEMRFSLSPWFWNREEIKSVRFEKKIYAPAVSAYMFQGCTSLKALDFTGLDISNVTDMRGMFYDCKSLTSLDISGWDTSKVTSMDNMFYGCIALTSLDISAWDTSNVTSMDNMFYGCIALTSLDISAWDTSKVTNMAAMFYSCRSLASLDLSGWDTSKVTSMNSMFWNCSSLTSLDLSSWDTSKVTNMGWMFYGCSSLSSLDLSGWDTSNVTGMSDMFYDCRSLASLDISGWDTSNVTDMHSIFSYCSSLSSLDLSGWDTSKVTSMGSMFYGCSALASLDLAGWDISNETGAKYIFNGCNTLVSLNASNWVLPQNIESLFTGFRSLTSLNLSGWDTSKVTNMYNTFSSCSSLVSLDISGWDTSNVTNMIGMFSYCSSLSSLDLSGWDTSKVTSMGRMFWNCSSLTSLDLSSWDTSKVTYIGSMFYGCSSLTSLDLSSWDSSKVTNMHNMFYDCKSLTSLDLSGWDTSKVTDMYSMFYGCKSLTSLDLSSWDASNVTYPYMYCIFLGCDEIRQITFGSAFDCQNKSFSAPDISMLHVTHGGQDISALGEIRNFRDFSDMSPAELEGTWIRTMTLGGSGAEDSAVTDIIKVLRYEGMTQKDTNEPTDRGYAPTNVAALPVFGGNSPMSFSDANAAKAAEYLSRLRAERFTAEGYSAAEVSEDAESGDLLLRDGAQTLLRLSLQRGANGRLELAFTSYAPGAVKLTLDGKEYLIVTPGDVNLDGTMNALDWITIMRWTLVASGGEYTSPNDEGFTIKVNGTDYNLWVLLADMTGTDTDTADSENWGKMVNSVDWITIMQLTLQAWKGSEQSELSDRFAIVIEKTSEPRYSENGVPIPDGDIRRVNYLNAAGENVTAEYAPPQRGSFVAFDDILIDGVYEYVLNSDGTVYFLEKPNAVKGVTFGGKDAQPVIDPTNLTYGGMTASEDTWLFVREILPDGNPRYSVKKLSDFQQRDQSIVRLLTNASYAYTTDASPLPIRRVLFGTLLLDHEIKHIESKSGWLLTTRESWERQINGERHRLVEGIDETGALVVLDLGVYENGDCGDYNKFDLIESGKLYAYDMRYETGISELFETPEGLYDQSAYGRSTFWTEASILAESGGVVQVRLDPENAQYLALDAIHTPNTYDLHYDSKTVIVNVHTRNGEIVYDSGVDEIGRTAPYDLKVHKADGTYEYSEQEYTNAYALVHTNGYISYIIVDSSYGGSVVGDALELHKGCDCDKADVYAGNIYSNLTGGVQKVTSGWNRR